MGFVPNWDKSELVPSQRFSFLGARFCLDKGLIGPSLDRLTKLQSLIQKMLLARAASARKIHSLLGQMESMAGLLPDGRAHKRLLQWHIKDCWSQADQPWDFHISLGPWFSQAISKWLNRDFLFSMVPLCRPPPDLFLFTDASLVGCGAHMGDLSASGQWSVHWQDQHINVLELRAVMLALKSFHQVIPHCHVLLSIDNTTVTAYLNKEGGPSQTLSFMATNLLDWCMKRLFNGKVCTWEAERPGRLPLQERADSSHRVDPSQGHPVSDFSILGDPPLRSVLHEAEQSTSGVCFSISRSTGMGSGRYVPVMGRNDSLCIPPNSTSDEGACENGERNMFGHPDSSMLGKSPILSDASFPAGCSSNQDSNSGGSFDPTSLPSFSSEARILQPARLAVLQGGLEKAGFLRSLPRESVLQAIFHTVSLQFPLEHLDGLVSRAGDGSHRSICKNHGRFPYLPFRRKEAFTCFY